MTDRAEGLVATFYSYKGGVGRSFLLANVAALLSKWGYRVLCVDWDIEAPGLDQYFRAWMPPSAQRGLVEFVQEYSRLQKPDWRDYVTNVRLPASEQPIALMTAGAEDDTFISRVQGIDWKELYDRQGFGEFLESVREEWKADYDLILIDSRTGVSDIGGICTVHLPDLLVFLFTANYQSIRGASRIASQVQRLRDRLPLNRAGLLMLPIASRFDSRVQEELSQSWIRVITESMEPFCEAWLDRDLLPRHILDLTRIPYFSVWSFGERLAALEEREADTEGITYYFATIAAMVARRLGDTQQLVSNRDGYVEGARRSVHSRPRNNKFQYDIYLSYSKTDYSLAREISAQLRALGCTIFFDADTVSAGRDLRSEIDESLKTSMHLALLFGDDTSLFQDFEIRAFLAASSKDPSRRVVRVSATNMRAAVPSILLDSKLFLDIRGQTPQEIANQIAVSLGLLPVTDRIPESLHLLEEEYNAVRIPDYVARVQKKDELAETMAAIVIRDRLDRNILVNQKSQGMLVALASSVMTSPQAGDAKRLIDAAPHARHLHVKYRFVLAFSKLIDKQFVSAKEVKSIKNVLKTFRLKADGALVSAIDATERQILKTT